MSKCDIVVLAPNAKEPPMDGGSLRSAAFRDEFRRFGLSSLWLGHDRTDVPAFPRLYQVRSKEVAALRTLAFRSHYISERVIGADWRAALRHAVNIAGSTTPVWCNFYWTYVEWAKAGGQGVIYIDTHNAEREWFENIAKGAGNPLTKLVCKVSIAHAEGNVRNLPPAVTLVHVSERDEAYFKLLAPQCRHVVVPNGCQMRAPETGSRRPGPPRLYFLGSLGVQMNHDALLNFATNYWPTLRDRCEFTVFGSNPSATVRQLCQRNGWQLHINLPAAQLDPLVREQDALALPFAYTAGSKLKLVDALSRGKYVLSTPAPLREMTNLPDTVLVGKTAADWSRLLGSMVLGDENKAACSREFSAQFSWPRVIGSFLAKETALHVKRAPLE